MLLIKRFLKKIYISYLLYSYKKKYSINFGFIDQGPGSIGISGDGEIIFGDSINLKSNTFMEVSGGLKIGSYFHTGRGLTIFTTNHNYRKPKFIPYDKEKIIGSVEIGDYVWFGANVTVCPGVRVGEGCVVGAGSVISKSLPDYSICAGNPCKVIDTRDIEHFKRLKAQKKFF